MPLPELESLHYLYAQRFIENRLPGIPLNELRQRVYQQTEILRKWYGGRMRDEPAPYRDTIEGYVYAYMPRGYRWIDELAGQSRELNTNLETAKRVAVLGPDRHRNSGLFLDESRIRNAQLKNRLHP